MNFRFSFQRLSSAVRRFSSKATDEVQSNNLWVEYNRLLREKPLITKSITSGVIAFIADIACQKAMASDKESKIDWKRTAKFTTMNLVLVGPTLHYWYGFLMAKIPGTTTLSAVYRVACDQFLFAPFFIIPAIFSFSSLLDGTPEKIPERLKADWAPTLVANFALWVPAQFINFKLVPAQFQVLFANMVGLVWNVYLSAAVNKDVPSATATTTIEMKEIVEHAVESSNSSNNKDSVQQKGNPDAVNSNSSHTSTTTAADIPVVDTTDTTTTDTTTTDATATNTTATNTTDSATTTDTANEASTSSNSK